MSKRRNKDPGRTPQIHPTRSFDQMVADATMTRFSGFIEAEIERVGQDLLARQQAAMGNLLTRLVATEEVLSEKLGVSKTDLANRVAAIQDRFEGFVEVTGGVELGDRVRLEIKTRTADQTEYQGSSRLQLEDAGTGRTLGKELEEALIGMSTGETKEVKFGKDGELTASIQIDRISREPKAASPVETAPQEASNVAPTAG